MLMCVCGVCGPNVQLFHCKLGAEEQMEGAGQTRNKGRAGEEEGSGQEKPGCKTSAVRWQGKDGCRAKGKADVEASEGQMMQGGPTRCLSALQFPRCMQADLCCLGGPLCQSIRILIRLGQADISPAICEQDNHHSASVSLRLGIQACAHCLHACQHGITICAKYDPVSSALQLPDPLHV